MSIHSMTGFASTKLETPDGSFNLELRSVNSRFLDLQFKIYDDYRSLESSFRDVISKKIHRGKLDIRFSFTPNHGKPNERSLNLDLVRQLNVLQVAVKQEATSARELSVADILKWPGVLEEAQMNSEAFQNTVLTLLENTLNDLVKTREKEGDMLTQTLLQCIEQMQGITNRITPLMPEIIKQYQQKAIHKMEEALGITLKNTTASTNSLAPSQEDIMNRIVQEVTLYGIKIDVSEELTRLNGHLEETREILKKGGQVGKRLDFMMQELNREANTLGSKAALKELSDASMALKLLIEQMREQVQNLE